MNAKKLNRRNILFAIATGSLGAFVPAKGTQVAPKPANAVQRPASADWATGGYIDPAAFPYRFGENCCELMSNARGTIVPRIL